MAIDVTQIHNLVRTYHRAFQDSSSAKPEKRATDHGMNNDRVSVSAEASRRSEQQHRQQTVTPKSHGKG
jgi:hypothetical protein